MTITLDPRQRGKKYLCLECKCPTVPSGCRMRCLNCGRRWLTLTVQASKITPKARARMRRVLKWRAQGKTLAWIGLRLKVTRERVRQIQSLAEARYVRLKK